VTIPVEVIVAVETLFLVTSLTKLVEVKVRGVVPLLLRLKKRQELHPPAWWWMWWRGCLWRREIARSLPSASKC
jgi:hypothetical protein